ncbi:MAG: hypothetical protein Q4G70_06120 [Pseudomonadota bacterium]|nr:hypothetical protein [Pseudomonadota bacterium]
MRKKQPKALVWVAMTRECAGVFLMARAIVIFENVNRINTADFQYPSADLHFEVEAVPSMKRAFF